MLPPERQNFKTLTLDLEGNVEINNSQAYVEKNNDNETHQIIMTDLDHPELIHNGLR